jgi:epoxyqueuosine reductase QueG
MNKDRFQILFGHNAAGWRGMGILQRNALIVCGNVQNEEHRQILLEHIHTPSEMLQLHALFSLAAYDGEIERIQGVLDRATPSVRRLYEEYR